MIRLSVNVNKVATVRNSRGGPIPSVVAAAEVCVRGRRAWHHGAPARGRPAHHLPGRPRPDADAGAARRPGRVQHRRRSAAGPAGARSRGPARTSARWCPSRPARSRVRPAGRPTRRRPGDARRRDGPAVARRAREPVRRPRARRRGLGRRRSAPTAWSCTRSRSRGPPRSRRRRADAQPRAIRRAPPGARTTAGLA